MMPKRFFRHDQSGFTFSIDVGQIVEMALEEWIEERCLDGSLPPFIQDIDVWEKLEVYSESPETIIVCGDNGVVTFEEVIPDIEL